MTMRSTIIPTPVAGAPYRRGMLVKDIIALAAQLQGVGVEDLKSPDRHRGVAWPRQRTMWLIRTVRPDFSWQRIGQNLGGRDHTTVIHGFRAVEARMLIDANERAVIEGLLAAVAREQQWEETPLDAAIRRAAQLMRRLQARRHAQRLEQLAETQRAFR